MWLLQNYFLSSLKLSRVPFTHISRLWRPLRMAALLSSISATPPIYSFGSPLAGYLLLPIVTKILNNTKQVPLVASCQLDFKPLTISLLDQKKNQKTSSFPLYTPSIQNIVLQFSIMEYHADILPGVRVNNICCCVCLCMDQVISWKTNQADQLCFLLLNPSWLLQINYCLSCACK